MNKIDPDEKAKVVRGRGRRVSALGNLLREMEVGDIYRINIDVDEIKNPYSCYNIGRTIGKKFSVNKITDTEYVITCLSAMTL